MLPSKPTIIKELSHMSTWSNYNSLKNDERMKFKHFIFVTYNSHFISLIEFILITKSKIAFKISQYLNSRSVSRCTILCEVILHQCPKSLSFVSVVTY